MKTSALFNLNALCKTCLPVRTKSTYIYWYHCPVGLHPLKDKNYTITYVSTCRCTAQICKKYVHFCTVFSRIQNRLDEIFITEF